MTKKSKIKKISFTERFLKDAKPLDMSNYYIDLEKRKKEEQETKRNAEQEEENRINKIKCPVCKSTNKHHHVKRGSNGIIGPGFSSWVVDEYLICKDCGVHYHDLNPK